MNGGQIGAVAQFQPGMLIVLLDMTKHLAEKRLLLADH